MGAGGLADARGNSDGLVQWEELQGYLTSEVDAAAHRQSGRAQVPEVDAAPLVLPQGTVAPVQKAVAAEVDEVRWRAAVKEGNRRGYEEYLVACDVPHAHCAHREEALILARGAVALKQRANDGALWERLSAADRYQDYIEQCTVCTYKELAEHYLALAQPEPDAQQEIETPHQPEPAEQDTLTPHVEPGQQADAPAFIRECDLQAASPTDPQKPTDIPGVGPETIDTGRAIPACERALAAAPTTARLSFQLGRALDAAGRDEDAVTYYRRAAGKGHAEAQYRLGLMHVRGRGATQDDVEAVKWYRKAAEQGHRSAQASLAWMYEKGRGVAQDNTEAVKWYRLAAAQGDLEAKSRLVYLQQGARKLGGSVAGQPAAQPKTAAGQRAILYEQGQDGAPGRALQGSVAWQQTQTPDGQPAIQARVGLPEQNVTATVTISKNTDAALPASHLIEVAFDQPANFGAGEIERVPALVVKPSEEARGEPLVGVAVPVTEGLFWIALSDEEAQARNNLQLLNGGEWFDLPILFKDGRRALIAFKKGAAGDRLFETVIANWLAGDEPQQQIEPPAAAAEPMETLIAEPTDAEAQNVRRLHITEGADYFGRDYDVLQGVDLEACKTACLGDGQCQAFTYNLQARYCFLKDGVGELRAADGAVSGRVVAASPQTQPQQQPEPQQAGDPVDVEGQNRLSEKYRDGTGVEQSGAEAVKWFGKATEQDYVPAQATLREMEVQPVPELLAGAPTDAEAQNALGEQYRDGGVSLSAAKALKWFRSIPQDDVEAVKWFRLAAEQGDARAQYNLGWMYEKGRGVAQDDAEAMELYRKAAAQGHVGAKSQLAYLEQDARKKGDLMTRAPVTAPKRTLPAAGQVWELKDIFSARDDDLPRVAFAAPPRDIAETLVAYSAFRRAGETDAARTLLAEAARPAPRPAGAADRPVAPTLVAYAPAEDGIDRPFSAVVMGFAPRIYPDVDAAADPEADGTVPRRVKTIRITADGMAEAQPLPRAAPPRRGG